MYISVTGLKLKKWYSWFLFYRFAIPSYMQAKKSDGNRFAATKKINGVYHTLTAWDTQQDMKNFLSSGAHRMAMQNFNKIANGKTYGYESSIIPNWQEAIAIWNKYANNYR